MLSKLVQFNQIAVFAQYIIILWHFIQCWIVYSKYVLMSGTVDKKLSLISPIESRTGGGVSVTVHGLKNLRITNHGYLNFTSKLFT